MKRWAAVMAAGSLALAALAGLVPGAAAGFSSALGQVASVPTAAWFHCADAFAADASTAAFQWRLTDADTTAIAIDSSGRGYQGAYSGSHTTVQDTYGTCPRDGTGSWTLKGASYVVGPKMSQAFSRTAFTMEARVMVPPTAASGGDILSACDSSTTVCSARDDRLYLASDGRLVFGTYSGSSFQILASAGSIADGTWHHVAGTVSAAGMLLYLDGRDITGTSTAYSGSTAKYSAGADPKTFTSTRAVQAYWRVGGTDGDNWPLWATMYLTGRIGWAAVYSTALSPTTIRSHWAAGR